MSSRRTPTPINDVFRKYRSLLDQAQSYYDQIVIAPSLCLTDDDFDELNEAYQRSLVDLSLQRDRVRLLIDQLGYVPEVPNASGIH